MPLLYLVLLLPAAAFAQSCNSDSAPYSGLCCPNPYFWLPPLGCCSSSCSEFDTRCCTGNLVDAKPDTPLDIGQIPTHLCNGQDCTIDVPPANPDNSVGDTNDLYQRAVQDANIPDVVTETDVSSAGQSGTYPSLQYAWSQLQSRLSAQNVQLQLADENRIAENDYVGSSGVVARNGQFVFNRQLLVSVIETAVGGAIIAGALPELTAIGAIAIGGGIAADGLMNGLATIWSVASSDIQNGLVRRTNTTATPKVYFIKILVKSTPSKSGAISLTKLGMNAVTPIISSLILLIYLTHPIL